MILPAFYAQVPTIRLRDPLADLLGAARRGVIEYGYADAVKLAGHSCPTVAAAYALTRRALAALYGDELPERGGLRVDLAAGVSEGVAGVTASVITLITGGAADGGFKGLAGQHGRRHLLAFGAVLPLDLRFTRRDTGAAVDAHADPSRVSAAPETGALLQRCLRGEASSDERNAFANLWQDRVRRLLIDHANDPDVYFIQPATRQETAHPTHVFPPAALTAAHPRTRPAPAAPLTL